MLTLLLLFDFLCFLGLFRLLILLGGSLFLANSFVLLSPLESLFNLRIQF